MSIEFNTNFEKIKLNKLYNDVIENNSTYNYNNQNNVTTNYNVDSSTNFSNSTNNDIETIDMTASTDDNISNNLNEVDQENYKDEVSTYVDNLIANVDQLTDEQKKRLYQAKSIDEANEIIIDIYTEIFGEMYGFSREEVIKLLTESATIEEIFDENFEVHIEAFMSFLTKSGLLLNSDEKNLIRSSKSWVNATKIANDIEIKQKRILLQSYGFNETDINRIINGEITIDELYNEIMAEDAQTRRYNLALVQIFNVLINSEDESLTRFRDLSINFSTFEEMQEYTNNLINKREQIINNFFSNEVVSVAKCACFFDDYILQQPGAYMYADDVGKAVDDQAKCTVLYYTYIDSNGLLQFAWDDPGLLDNGYNLDPDEEVTIKKVSYYDVYGNTEYYRLLRSYVVNNDMVSLSDEVDYYWERNENQPVVEGIEEQLKENETNIEYLQQMRSYIIEETRRYTFSELEYTRHSDFEINCHYSTDIIKYDISDGNKTLINFEDILIEYKNRGITLSVKDATLIYLYMCVFSGQEVDGDVEKYIDELSDQDRYFAEDFIEYEWYRFLSNEEKGVFYYICNTKGYEAGFDYLKSLDSYLDKARYYEKVSKAQEEANFGYACLGIVWGIFEGLDNLFYSIDSTISGRKMRLSETFCSSDVWRSQFIIDISNDWGTGWGLGFNVFFTVLDMTPTLAAAYFTAGSSLVLQSTIQTLTIATTMGVKSYSSTLNMALELGLSDSSAILLALSTAAVEILMEKWSFGHLIGIKESLSATTINSIKTLASKIVKPEWAARVTNIICISASLLKQGFIEADEEICTFFADNFLEQLIAGKLSNYNQQIDYYIGCGYSEEEAVSLVSKASKKELFDTFVVSFMSGILSGGISYKLSEKSYIKTINKLSDNIIDIYSGNKTNSVVEYRQEIRSLLKDGNYIGIIDKIMSTQGVSIEQKKTIASEVVKVINKYIELDTSMQTKLNEKINNSIDLNNHYIFNIEIPDGEQYDYYGEMIESQINDISFGKNDNAVNSIIYNNLITGMKAHDARFGKGSAINELYNYLYKGGDIIGLSRASGFRQLVSSLSRSELKTYFNIIQNGFYMPGDISKKISVSSYFSKYGNSKDSTFGANQGGIESLCDYYINGKKYTYRQAMDIFNQAKAKGQPIPRFSIKKNWNSKEYVYLKQKLTSLGFLDSDASIIMSTVNDAGACSYATVVNEIFASFIGREVKFEKHFGFPTFITKPDGTKVLNTNELLLDLYVFANNTSNGGYLINDNNTLNRYAMSDSRFDVFGRKMLDAEKQIRMSSSSGKNTTIINKFLNSKGISYSIIQSYNYFSNRGISDYDFNNMISDISNLFNSGKQVSLGIYKGGKPINMISTNPYYYSSWSTNSFRHGHSIFVTDIGTDCFYVSSGGQEFKIPFSDLQNGGKFVITISEIN